MNLLPLRSFFPPCFFPTIFPTRISVLEDEKALPHFGFPLGALLGGTVGARALAEAAEAARRRAFCWRALWPRARTRGESARLGCWSRVVEEKAQEGRASRERDLWAWEGEHVGRICVTTGWCNVFCACLHVRTVYSVTVCAVSVCLSII